MKKIEKPLTASETLELISKQWANKKDIMDIGYIGDNHACSVLREIQQDYINKGWHLKKGQVPMEGVVEYFKINISYLKKVCNEKNRKEL